MNLIQAKITVFIFFVLVTSCETNEIEIPQNDYIIFEIGGNMYNYQNQDSTFQICSERNSIQPEFDFVSIKTFGSENKDFKFISLTILNRSKDCPSDKLDSKSDFIFTLTAVNSSGAYVDYFNMGRLESFSWTQESKDDLIIINGQLGGWIYKYFNVRSDEVVEPAKLDSLFLQNGKFQFTIH